MNILNGNKFYGSIDWISDCEYVLTCKNTTGSIDQNYINKKMYVKIIKTYGNKFLCLAEMDSIKKEIELIKIK